MKKRYPLFWVTSIVLLTTGVIYFGREEVISAVGKMDPKTMFLLLILQLITLAVTSLRWKFLLGKAKQYLSLGKVFLIIMAGSFVESVTPSTRFGGEAAKIYLLKKHTDLTYSNIVGLFLAIKYYSWLPFLVLAAASFSFVFLVYRLSYLYILPFCMLVLFCAALGWVYHRGAAKQKLPLFESEEDMILDNRFVSGDTRERIVLPSFMENGLKKIDEGITRSSVFIQELMTPQESRVLLFLSAFMWFLYPLKIHIVSGMLGYQVPLVSVFVATYVAYVVGLLPLLPGGLGSFEAAMALLLSLSGLEIGQGLAVALVSRVITFWFPLLISSAAALRMLYMPPLTAQTENL